MAEMLLKLVSCFLFSKIKIAGVKEYARTAEGR